MNSCILLAAGASSRFGSPKALATIGGKTIVERLQRTLIGSKLEKIVIVLGADRAAIEPFLLKHKKIKIVYNKDHNLGQTSSFKAGCRALAGKTNILLLPIDYPCVKSETIDRLIEAFERRPCDCLVPAYKAKRGHPPVFAASLRKEILALSDEAGVNELVRRHALAARELSVDDPGVVLSFNTREEFEALLSVHAKA